jgi:hypothetical protein
MRRVRVYGHPTQRTEAEVELALVTAKHGAEALAQLTAALRQGDASSLRSTINGLAPKLLERPSDAGWGWGVKELHKQALAVVTSQSACADSEISGLRAAARESTMAGLAQGLGFLRTRRVDLSDERFGDVGPEQALAIATACGPELDALFLPVPLALPPEVVTQLKELCPQARCLALGGDVTEAGFEEILRQCTTPDTELGAVMGHGFFENFFKEPDTEMANALGAAPIAEGMPPTSACALDVEPEPGSPEEMEPEPEGNVLRCMNTFLATIHDATPQAAAAGHRITWSPQAADGAAVCYTLDLTDVAQFRHLTDAGLGALTTFATPLCETARCLNSRCATGVWCACGGSGDRGALPQPQRPLPAARLQGDRRWTGCAAAVLPGCSRKRARAAALARAATVSAAEQRPDQAAGPQLRACAPRSTLVPRAPTDYGDRARGDAGDDAWES